MQGITKLFTSFQPLWPKQNYADWVNQKYSWIIIFRKWKVKKKEGETKLNVLKGPIFFSFDIKQFFKGFKSLRRKNIYEIYLTVFIFF